MNEKRLLSQAHALAALVAAVALIASAVAGGVWKLDTAPPPFIWRDVALVCFLSALPIAASLAVALHLRLSLSKPTIAVLALEALVLLIVPHLYIRARCHRDAHAVVALLEQSRLGEAQTLLQRLQRLNPRGQINGYSLPRLAAEVDRAVHDLEHRIAVPLPPNTSDQERYTRARDLAMLGKTEAALATIDSSPSASALPAASNLRGTIHETRGHWPAALDGYTRARAAWQPLPDSPGRTAGLIQAATGIAWSQRKLGRLTAAETAFHDILRLAPTADSHFLLAQFYEDTQQAAKAQSHARQAQLLDPPKYARRVEQLLDKLQTAHFGCLGVFAEKNNNFASSTIVPPLRNP